MAKYKMYLNKEHGRAPQSNERDGGWISTPMRGLTGGVYLNKVNGNSETMINLSTIGSLTQNLDIKNIDQKLPAGVQSVYNSIKNNSQYSGNNRFSYISGSGIGNGTTNYGAFVA